MKNKIKIVIVEDEHFAAENLARMVRETLTEIEDLIMLDSVAASVAWFASNKADLAFFDIQLGDGNSFEIFDKVKIDCPIIFTTAFDQYAIKAFKVNSIDYLLKPIKDNDLRQALNKYQEREKNSVFQQIDYEQLAKVVSSKSTYRKRFTVHAGTKIHTVPTEQIACFHVDEGITYLLTFDEHQYDLSMSLEALELELDPDKFFRINRQVTVNYDAIDQMYQASKNRIAIKLKTKRLADTIVSVRKMPDFKTWIGK